MSTSSASRLNKYGQLEVTPEAFARLRESFTPLTEAFRGLTSAVLAVQNSMAFYTGLQVVVVSSRPSSKAQRRARRRRLRAMQREMTRRRPTRWIPTYIYDEVAQWQRQT